MPADHLPPPPGVLSYDPVLAETVSLAGHGGDVIEGYLARPMHPGPVPGVVVIHHMPGYDFDAKQITRTLAVRGFAALCPNLYFREAPGASPDDAAARVRAPREASPTSVASATSSARPATCVAWPGRAARSA